jgi:hypothetical protein
VPSAAETSAATSQTRIYGYRGHYESEHTYDGKYSTQTTRCAWARGSHVCETETVSKPQPAPIVQDPRSSRIMDGHGPR